MNKIKHLLILMFLLSISFYILGCSGSINQPSGPITPLVTRGSITINIDQGAKYIPDNATKIIITITGQGLDSPIITEIPPNQSTVTINDVPPGNKRITITSVDNNGTVLSSTISDTVVSLTQTSSIDVNLGVDTDADGNMSPGTITIPIDTTLAWFNGSNANKSFSNGPAPFDQSIVEPGKSKTYTFPKVGIFEYTFGGAAGTVIVKGPPRLDTLTPNFGTFGDNIVIEGAGFGDTQGTSIISFNGTIAAATDWDSTAITCTVPNNASTGEITVIVNNQSSNGLNFTVNKVLESISITPQELIIGFTLNNNQQFTATGNYNDGSHEVLNDVTWNCDEAIGAIDQAGLFTAVAFNLETFPITGDITAQKGDINTEIAVDVHGWNLEVVDFDPGGDDYGQYNSLVFDNSNNPIISYYNASPGNETLKCAWRNANPWNYYNIDSPGKGQFTSIDINSDGNPRISYYDETNTFIKFAWWTGAGWNTEKVDNSANVGQDSSLIFNNSNTGYISYYDLGNNTLKCAVSNSARPAGLNWTSSQLNNPGDGGANTSIALDDTEKPCIAYSKGGELHYIKYNGATWDDSLVENAGFSGLGGISLTLDNSNNPIISYYDDNNQSVKVAVKNGGSWDITVLDTTLIGGDTSVAIDPSTCHIWVIYYYSQFGGNGDLKLANWDGDQWEKSVIESGAGLYCSLKFDALGRPGISYYKPSIIGNPPALKYACWR